jgi:hypothetical protein
MKNIRLALAGTLATVGAAQVGNAYGNGDINPLTHKVLHAAVGATSGALIDGRNGALAGGLGAFTSELAAELFCPDKLSIMQSAHELEATKGRLLTQEEFTNHYWQKVHTAQGNAQLLAAATAFVARQDVDIAHFTSSAALENNFLVLAAYGATAASAAYSAYCIGNAYKQEGIEGALNQLGIEIAVNAAGYAGGKVIFKAAGKVYPTALKALEAVLENNPALKKSIGGTIDALKNAAGKLSESSLGKAVTRAETAILNAESKVAQQLASIGKGKGAERIAQRSATELKDVIPLIEKDGVWVADLSALNGGSSSGLMVMSQQSEFQAPMVIQAPLAQALAPLEKNIIVPGSPATRVAYENTLLKGLLRGEKANPAMQNIVKDAFEHEDDCCKLVQRIKYGHTYADALRDFESLGLVDVKKVSGKETIIGCTPDGLRVNVRPDSTYGKAGNVPTLEIYNPANKQHIKIRYLNHEQ